MEIWLRLGGTPIEGFARIGEGPWSPAWLKEGYVIEEDLRPALLGPLTRP